MTPSHIPILVKPIIDALIEPFRALPVDAPPHWIIDCTLGGGGHTAALLAALQESPALRQHKVLSLDQDEAAIAVAKERFAAELAEGRLEIIHSRMSQASTFLQDATRKGRALGLMADLGFSSDQINDPDRGLSFQQDGPLDMRLDPSNHVSCKQLLERMDERKLADLIFEYGEERYSRRIAGSIINARRSGGIPDSTLGLVEIIRRALPPPARHGRIHFATRTFQALRIAVNEEMEELDSLLNRVILDINVGGRVAILSFHSLEDRKVKLAFRGEHFHALTKKPLEADDEEVRNNPRSRSARLRIGEKR